MIQFKSRRVRLCGKSKVNTS